MSRSTTKRDPTPRSVVGWVVLFLVAAVALAVGILSTRPRGPIDPWLALVLAGGVALTSRLPIRYRLDGSVHALTADDAVVMAMLMSLPGAWAPVLAAVGVTVGNLAWRRPRMPLIRIVFNASLVAVCSSAAVVVHEAVLDGTAGAGVDPRAAVAVVAATVAYSLTSALGIAVLFDRLGTYGVAEGLRRVLPVRRVTVPVTAAAGLGVGWLAQQGPFPAVVGLAVAVTIFGSLRAAFSAQLQRDRARDLRDIGALLLRDTGVEQPYDRALSRLATAFGAASAELLLVDESLRHVDRDGAVVAGAPTSVAVSGVERPRAVVLAPGSAAGGPLGVMVAPLLDGATSVGALVLHGRRQLEPSDHVDLDVLEAVATELVVARRDSRLVAALERERGRLARQSELLGGVLTSASDGIVLLDDLGAVLSWNPAMSRLLDMPTAADVVGRPWRDVLTVHDASPEDPDSVGTAIRHARDGRELERTWLHESGDGHRWLRVRLSPAEVDDRPAVVLVVRDVTEATRIERLKSDFVATVSHELRTPLTPLKGFIEIGLARRLDEGQQQKFFEAMRRQVGRLDHLVADLLTVADADGEALLSQVDLLDLGSLVRRSLDAGDGAERIRPEFAEVTVAVDPAAVSRIVDALVSNALKHTDGEVRVRVMGSDGRARLEVVDEGPGIDPTDHELVFQQFVRLGDHLHRTQGPGLGLTIARLLARRLGGDIELDSAIGRGSTFTLTLPQVGWPGRVADRKGAQQRA